MEDKHFSHNHNLVLHQISQGSEIHCSGCKSPESPGSGTVYACWKCSYFLHEECFRAPRSLNHSSHPLHPLTLMPYPTYPSAKFFCNSCNLDGNGFCYCCSECEFDIHVLCAHKTNYYATNPHGSHQTSIFVNPSYPNLNSNITTNPQIQSHVYPPVPIQNSPFPSYVPSS